MTARRAEGATPAELDAAWIGYLREHHALAQAIDGGSLDDVRACLANGSSPEDTHVLGIPAVSLAASLGRLDIVRMLLAAGADIDQRDEYGNTALWCAANAENVEVCRALLDLGADPTIPGDDGSPPWGRARGALSDELRRAAEAWVPR